MKPQLPVAVQNAISDGKLFHALFFTGKVHEELLALAHEVIARMLCQQSSPCGTCKDCILLATDVHPDVMVLEPDGHTIKIDAIRNLQQQVWRSKRRPDGAGFVIIEHAERLNHAAANALLKILEEPPSRVIFILLGSGIESLPLTIKSRVQHHALADNTIELPLKAQIQADFAAVSAGTLHPVTVAASWKDLDAGEVALILYNLVAEQIYRAPEFQYYLLLDEIIRLRRSLQQGINLNLALFYENLLVSL